MCGIAGILSINAPPPQRDSLEVMNRAMIHRGPDGQGVSINGNVGLAHCRLAIIDPAEGQQPFVDDDTGLAITYNGEVYNYLEIRHLLERRYRLRTQSDTEVVVKAFDCWGIECLDRFRGMFAFAVHDRRNRQVFLVRDRLGIKPLFYCQNEGRFMFASELSALVAVAGSLEIDPTSVAEYFRWQYVPTPKSIYKGVHKLEPGHFLRIDLVTGTIEKHCYWSLRCAPVSAPESQLLEELNALLQDIVKIYTRSDVPFGAFLSGGVDSSLITALMSRQLSSSVKTFSIGFQEKTHSELPFAREAAEVIGSDHFDEVLMPSDASALLGSIASHFGEPFADSSAVPTWLVSELAADKVKMVLSGDGGDELFGGYWSYVRTFQDMQRCVPPRLRQILKPLTGMLADVRGVGRFADLFIPPLDKHLAQRDIFLRKELRTLLIHHFDTEWPWRNVLNQIPKALDDVARFQYLDLKTYLVDDILTKVDRMSMAHSLEVRVPLLDHKLVEFALTLPLEARLARRNGQVRTKHLLKCSAERFFSTNFLNRPKMGFGIPIVQWCQNELKERIMDGYVSPTASVFDWLDFRAVHQVLKQFYSGHIGLVAHVWALLMFSIWLEKSEPSHD